MSECCGATTISTDAEHRWGSIGFSMAGCETRVFRVGEGGGGGMVESKLSPAVGHLSEQEQGEICFRCAFSTTFYEPETPLQTLPLLYVTRRRGRHIMMGYLCNPLLGEEHVAEMTKKNEVGSARAPLP